jgi:hypothetical protein
MTNFKFLNLSSLISFFTLFFVLFIFLYFKLNIPVNWLGMQDGYFYGNMIKAFILDWKLVSLDMEYPSNYPPYFFWMLGRIGSLFNINDLGLLQKYAFLLVIPLFFSCYFNFIKFYFKNFTTALVIFSIIILMLISSTGTQQIYQKPHEVFSLLSIFIFLIAIASNKKSYLYFLTLGIFLGILFGSFAHYVLFSIFSYALLLFFRRFDWCNIKHNLTFALGFLIASFPLTISFLHNFKINNTFGNVSYIEHFQFTRNYLSIEQSNILNLLGIFLSIGFILVYLRKFYVQRKILDSNELIIIWFSIIILIHLVFYFLFYYLYMAEIYYVDGFNKMLATFPIFSSFLIVLAFSKFYTFIINKPKNNFIANYLNNNFSKKQPTKFILFIFAFLFFLLSVNYFNNLFLKRYSEFQYSVLLSDARNNFLKPHINSFQHLKDKHNLTKYIASGEFSFLNYYIRGKFTNFIIFNHTYSSSLQNFIDDVYALKKLVHDNNEDGFIYYLKQNNVNTIVLEKNNSILPVMINYGPFKTSLREDIELNPSFISSLMSNNKIKIISNLDSIVVLKIIYDS